MDDRPEARQDRTPAQPPTVLAGSRVVLLVSKGPCPDPAPVYVGVPEVMSEPQGTALEKLEDAGLSARVFDEPHQKVPHGHVIAQTPQAEQTALTNAEVVLLVSSGRPAEKLESVPLPNVAGRTEAEAAATIREAGLSAQTVHDWSATVPVGIVIDQIPNAASVRAHVKQSLWWLWTLIAVVAVLAIAAGAFMWFNRMVPVPNVTGMATQPAQESIRAAGFRVGTVTTTQTAAAAEVGKVVSQVPAAGQRSRAGTAIDIVVSGGQSLVTVPDLSGMTQSQAQDTLESLGLRATIATGNSGTVAKGRVMGQAPQAGQMLPTGTSVGVTISQGPEAVPVPEVVEQTERVATDRLKAAGFNVTVVKSPNSAPVGDVYAQAPVAGTLVQAGSTISIHVSSGPAPQMAQVEVPDVIGDTESTATNKLEDLGFEVEVTQIAGGTEGQVVGQAPAADMFEPKGSTITILVSTGSAP